MSKTNPKGAEKRRDPTASPIEPVGERSSPGSREDESNGGVADLQPEDVEGDDTAR
jgi:hypothetical protein